VCIKLEINQGHSSNIEHFRTHSYTFLTKVISMWNRFTFTFLSIRILHSKISVHYV